MIDAILNWISKIFGTAEKTSSNRPPTPTPTMPSAPSTPPPPVAEPIPQPAEPEPVAPAASGPTRQSLGVELNLTVELIDQGHRNRPGSPIRPTSITVHNTSNTHAGADADAHSKFVRNTGHYIYQGRERWVSWHYTVDDTKLIKHLPINEKAYHAGAANNSSIAIETCMNDGIDQDAADDRLAKLVAVLLYDLDAGVDAVKTHRDWTGKNCPVLLLKKWPRFMSKVESYLTQIGPRPESFSDAMTEGQDFNRVSPQVMPESLVVDELDDVDHEAIAAAILAN